MSQKIRKKRITKEDFHARGGFDNPALFRLQSRGGAWRYYVKGDRKDIGRTTVLHMEGFEPYNTNREG